MSPERRIFGCIARARIFPCGDDRKSVLHLDCDDALRLAGSLTCAVQFHGAGISQELSRASERDFIKVPLRKTSPPGACFRRGRTGGLLCANDSNDVQTHRGVVSVGEPALTHQRPRLLTFTSALVRAISVSASVSTSAPFNVDGNAIPAMS